MEYPHAFSYTLFLEYGHTPLGEKAFIDAIAQLMCTHSSIMNQPLDVYFRAVNRTMVLSNHVKEPDDMPENVCTKVIPLPTPIEGVPSFICRLRD